MSHEAAPWVPPGAWVTDWGKGGPISNNLSIEVEKPAMGRFDPLTGTYEHKPSGFMRVTVQGKIEDVEPYLAEIVERLGRAGAA
jgi:hypothetical protein